MEKQKSHIKDTYSTIGIEDERFKKENVHKGLDNLNKNALKVIHHKSRAFLIGRL